jgi:anti-anti-sigma factor
MTIVQVAHHGLTITIVGKEVIAVFVAGPLNASTAQLLARTLESLLRQPFERLSLDLAGVTRVDRRGIAVVLEACRRASAAGRELAIRSPSSQVADLLESAASGASEA